MDPATILAISQLLAQLIPAGINLYAELEQNSNGAVQPLATVLANSNANWDDIIAIAKAQTAPAVPPAEPAA